MKKIFCLLILLLTSGCIGSNPETPAGHEGYVYESPRVWGEGGFQGVVNGPGNFGVSLWRNKVNNIDIRPQTHQENFEILTKEDLKIKLSFQAIIGIEKGKVKEVVENYGGVNWYPRYVAKKLRSLVHTSMGLLPAKDVKNKRIEVASDVQKALHDYLEGTPFYLTQLTVGSVRYPDSVVEAINAKVTEEEKYRMMDIAKKTAKAKAAIKIIQAEGIARSQAIINKTLTDKYLQHEAIEAQELMASSPNHTTIYIPSGANGIPLVRNIQ